MSQQLFYALNGGVQFEQFMNVTTGNETITLTQVSTLSQDDIEINWGDGTIETYTPATYSAGNGNQINHTYTAGTYDIKIKGQQNIVGTLIISSLTQLNSINISKVASLSINVSDNTNMASIVMGANKSYGNLRLSNSNLTSIDFRGSSYSGGSTTQFIISDNASLSSVTNFGGLGDVAIFRVENTLLDMTWPFDTATRFRSGFGFRWRDCGMSQANQDANVNALYDNRAVIDSGHSVEIIGATNPNATPSGTKDGSTDWSGGVPTSPMAKIYDLENNVTGTYNFTFTDV